MLSSHGITNAVSVLSMWCIWSTGRLMMTVFWYYRPHELDSLATQGLTFRKVRYYTRGASLLYGSTATRVQGLMGSV